MQFGCINSSLDVIFHEKVSLNSQAEYYCRCSDCVIDDAVVCRNLRQKLMLRLIRIRFVSDERRLKLMSMNRSPVKLDFWWGTISFRRKPLFSYVIVVSQC